MSDTELRRELLKVIADEVAQGRPPLASALLQEAQERWKADEFEVREAIWYLLSTNQLVLSPERTLRPAAAEEAHA